MPRRRHDRAAPAGVAAARSEPPHHDDACSRLYRGRASGPKEWVITRHDGGPACRAVAAVLLQQRNKQ
jgi:hypothetical protein